LKKFILYIKIEARAEKVYKSSIFFYIYKSDAGGGMGMIFEKDLRNRRIIIKSLKDQKTIADTQILNYDALNNIVRVSAVNIPEREYEKIYALIFGHENLYEYVGAIRGTIIANEMEILLGKSRMKEDRKQLRYNISMTGMILSIIISGWTITLRKPIEVKTINISSSGILFQADAGSFGIGNEFMLLLEIEEKAMKLKCEVIRIQNSTIRTEEYGCKVNAAVLV